MMKKIIAKDGSAVLGEFHEPVGIIEYERYALKTPMGLPVFSMLRKRLFNQFLFFGIPGPEYCFGLAVIDLKYASSGFFYVLDRANCKIFDKSAVMPPGFGSISPDPSEMSADFHGRGLSIRIRGSHFSVKTKSVSLSFYADAAKTAPLRLCTRCGYRGWVYTEKTAPVEVKGHLEKKEKRIPFSSPQYFGFSDWTAGYMRYSTFWNWGASACILPGGRKFALNLSQGVNETGFTENTFWVDGEKNRVGPVHFACDKKNLYAPWRMTSSDGKVDLSFFPEHGREEKVGLIVFATRFTQLIGSFRGRVKTARGETIAIRDIPGWAEDHYARW